MIFVETTKTVVSTILCGITRGGKKLLWWWRLHTHTPWPPRSPSDPERKRQGTPWDHQNLPEREPGPGQYAAPPRCLLSTLVGLAGLHVVDDFSPVQCRGKFRRHGWCCRTGGEETQHCAVRACVWGGDAEWHYSRREGTPIVGPYQDRDREGSRQGPPARFLSLFLLWGFFFSPWFPLILVNDNEGCQLLIVVFFFWKRFSVVP